MSKPTASRRSFFAACAAAVVAPWQSLQAAARPKYLLLSDPEHGGPVSINTLAEADAWLQSNFHRRDGRPWFDPVRREDVGRAVLAWVSQHKGGHIAAWYILLPVHEEGHEYTVDKFRFEEIDRAVPA